MGAMRDAADEIRSVLAGVREDIDKSDRGVASAGVRVRKALQEVKQIAQEARVYSLQRDKAAKLVKENDS